MKRVLLIFLILTCVLRLSAQTNAPARLALVAESTDASSAVDVLTAQLSGNKNLQLLERNEIEKVYREQGLSAGNKDYLKLGQILGADGLLLMELAKDGTNQFLNVRLIVVKPGVVLASERFPWPLADISQWAEGFGKHLNPLIPKLTVLVKEAIPISVVNFRSAVQSDEALETERQMTLLVIERLSRERQMFVLERRKMQLLSAEKEMTRIDNSAFWDGSYLLEGTIDRDGYSKDTMTINARLIPPKGGTPLLIDVSCSRTNLPEAINKLVGKILDNLNLSQSATTWNPADEANQYYDEANWALRWTLYEQAQAASESAWALGDRTNDLAMLRIRSYEESVFTPAALANSHYEDAAIPDATKLRPAIRALELFLQDAPRALTNTSALDLGWFDLGLQTLHMASRLLNEFYNMAETRQGNEPDLADLRSLARKTAAFLIAGEPDKRKINEHSLIDWFYWNQTEVSRSLEELIWEENGIWQAKPADTLPAIKELLANGFHPQNLPRVIGWSWDERKGVPSLLKSFVDQLCTSTNPEVRLEGRYLALLRTPDDFEGDFDTCEQKLLAEIWDQRRSVLADPGRFTLLARTEQALRDKKYLLTDGNKRLEDATLIEFMHRLRKDYLVNNPNYDKQVFFMMFPQRIDDYSQSEALELVPLMEEFQKRTQANSGEFRGVNDTLQRISGTARISAQKQNSTIVWPAEQPFGVDFKGWKLKTGSNFDPKPNEIKMREGKIWCWAFYLQKGMFDSPTAPRAFIQIDPATAETVEIPFPPQLDPSRFNSGSSFEVMDGSLFASSPNKLMRFRFSEKKWEEIPVPVDGQAKLTALNGRLYLATDASLLELEPNSNSVQVIVSSRRRPVANELDSLWNGMARLFVRSDGRLGVQVTNLLFSFDPVGRGWFSKVTLPDSLAGKWIELFSNEGVVLQPYHPMAHRYLLAFGNNKPQPELLLEQLNPREPKTVPVGRSYGQPRWNWPEPFRLDFPFFFSEGQSLWMFHPRTLPWGRKGSPDAEPIAFQDNRQVTLLNFASGRLDCLEVPLIFQKDGSPFDLFGQHNNSFWFGSGGPMYLQNAPFCMATDQGFIVICPDFAGHWLIPKAVLQSHLKPLPTLFQQPILNNNGLRQQSDAHTTSGVLTNLNPTLTP